MKLPTRPLPTEAARRTPLRAFLRLALILLCGIVVGFVLLLGAYALPTARMESNVLLSMPTFDGTWGPGEEGYHQLLKGYQTAQLDNSTDSHMLMTAIHRSDGSLLTRATDVCSYTSESGNAYFTLRLLASEGTESLANMPMTRYWLGYLIFLKPLLLVCTYMDIRMLNMLCQGALLAAIIALLQRRGLGRYIPAFCLSLACVSPFVVPYSMQFSTVFYIFSGAMALMLAKPRWISDRLGETAFFMLIGMATSYFDFLTYPIATFGMPFVLLMLTREDADQPRNSILLLVKLLAAWGVGYFGMWAGKWLIAALFSAEPFWQTVIGKIMQRTSLDAGGESITRLDVLKSVLGVFMKKPYMLLGVIAAIGYGISLYRARGKRIKTPAYLALTLALTALLPIMWYVLTANHTYNHLFFTSRGLCVTAFALCCLLSRYIMTKREQIDLPDGSQAVSKL